MALDIGEAALAVGLCLWLVLTPARRIVGRWSGGLIVSFLLPRWTFFAPNPGTSSYYLLARYGLPGGWWGQWAEISCSAPDPSPWIRWFWNPPKTQKKALVDAVAELMVAASEIPTDERDALQLSMPYIKLLNVASQRNTWDTADRVQFLLVEETFVGNRRTILLSAPHMLGRRESWHAPGLAPHT